MGIAVKSSGAFAAEVAGLAFTMVTTIVIARILGTTGKGELTATFLIPMFMSQFLSFYISGSVVYWLAQGKYDKRVVIGTAITFMMFVGILSFLAYAGFVLFAESEVTRGADRVNLVLAGLLVPLGLASLVFAGAFLSQETVWPQNISRAARPLVDLVLLVVLCLSGTNYLRSAVLARVLTAVAAFLFTLCVAARYFQIRLRLNFGALRDLLCYGLYGHLSMILGFIVYRIDMFFVLLIAGKTELGLYSTAVGFAEMLWLAPASLAMLVFPRVAKGSKGAGAEAAAQACRHSLLLTGAGGLVYLLAGRWIIGALLGREFVPAYSPLVLLLPGIWLNSMGKSTAAYLAGRGHIRKLLWVSTPACGANIVLNFMLIPRYGMNGAAVATTLSYTLAWGVCTFLFLKTSGLRIQDAMLPRRSDLAAYRTLLLRKIRSRSSS